MVDTEKQRQEDIKFLKKCKTLHAAFTSKQFYRLKKKILHRDDIIISKLAEISRMSIDEVRLLFLTSTDTPENLESVRGYIVDSIQRYA